MIFLKSIGQIDKQMNDPLNEYRATNSERKQAKQMLSMLINGQNYKNVETLCYVCQKINKSTVCPICHKGVCNVCMRHCSVCNMECCYLCMQSQYNHSQEVFICPKCSK